MQVRYRLFESVVDPYDPEEAECELYEEDTDKLSVIVRKAYQQFNIRGIDAPFRIDGAGVWGSDHPVEDRAFFEEGLHKFYLIEFPGLNPRHYDRVNRMFLSLEPR